MTTPRTRRLLAIVTEAMPHATPQSIWLEESCFLDGAQREEFLSVLPPGVVAADTEHPAGVTLRRVH